MTLCKIKISKDTKEVHLVARDNDLTSLYFDLLNSGYEAGITHQAGIITDLKLRMNKVKYKIKTQNLIKFSADGCIAVNDEDVYNKMNLAMYNFNKSLFNPFHKSYYSELDIKILNESRTVVPSGLLYPLKSIPKAITEIDITKAFTNPFINIYEIMEFCQFDKWQVYDDTVDFDKLNAYTLLYVEKSFFKTSGMILFNKKYPLIYKAVWDKIKDERLKRRTKILAYKQPCHTQKVNYKDIYNQLMNTKISDNPEEDKMIKKLIGNVNYGLLEKGGSTSSKSFPFKHLDEATEYQAELGGRINKITQMEINGEGYEREGQKCYILNLKDTAELTNGFRYIKELILQMHNFSMYEAYEKLIENKVKVYSAKTDAFVIDTCNVDKARDILDFNNDVGGWRVSHSNEEIILPSVE